MKLNDLLDKFYLSEIKSEREDLYEQIKDELSFDDLNTEYFLSLVTKYRTSSDAKKQIFINQDNLPKDSLNYASIAWPTAILDDELMKHLPSITYSSLLEKYDKNKCEDVVLWIKKMQAGTGSSIERKRYLSEKLNRPLNEIKIGAKGTDLFVDIDDKTRLNIVELQLMQSISAAEEKRFAGIILQDIVSNETEESIANIWEKTAPLYGDKKYIDIVKEKDGLGVHNKSYQYLIPTIDQAGKFTYNRMSPGGHGLFGVDALRAAIIPGLRPDITDKILISSVGNGEDLGSSPDPLMCNWMAKENIPIAMVTTTKTNIDLKGGQISLLKENDNYYATIIEKAQAEETNQLDLFYQLGLREGDKEAFFNTNMVLINYNVLIPIMEKIINEIGIRKTMEVICPDLIINVKKQIDSDNVERAYYQLEGALGSVMLNFDRFYREKYNKPLVHFLNVEAEYRDSFFAPIKTGFDFMMQFYSDRFKLDRDIYKLRNQNRGHVPMVDLKDAYYKDILNVMNDFQNVYIKHLEKLELVGRVNLSNMILDGQVIIINETGEYMDIPAILQENSKELRFKDVKVICYENKDIVIESI